MSLGQIWPSKLRAGDEVRVIAPAESIALISPLTQEIANQRFLALDLKLTFGEHVSERNAYDSSRVDSRLADIHSAFLDEKVKAIMTVIGGSTCYQLLSGLDWEVILKNPKIFCGYSDITVLNNAFLNRTGLVTYSGPHYSTFGQRDYFDFTFDHFKKCLFEDGEIDVRASEQWSEDNWYIDQENRELLPNNGYIVINEGVSVKGTIVGGNLESFSRLFGTEYMPDLTDTVVFLEHHTSISDFVRLFSKLVVHPGFEDVRALVFGRFTKSGGVDIAEVANIIKTIKQLSNVPVIGNVDFGHTDPKITFPIGGVARIDTFNMEHPIIISQH